MLGLNKNQLILFAVILTVFIAIFYFMFFTDKEPTGSVPVDDASAPSVNGSGGGGASNPKPEKLKENPSIGRVAYANKNGVKVYRKGFQSVFKVANNSNWIGTIKSIPYKDWYGIQTTSMNELVYVMIKDVKFE